jgi:hypothetical protein
MTPTPPRRRWYQFSLATMFVVVTVVAIGVWQFKEWQRGNERVIIGTVRGMPKYSNAVKNDLRSNGIECSFHGSKRYVIYVRRGDSRRAREILSDPMASPDYETVLFEQDYEAD